MPAKPKSATLAQNADPDSMNARFCALVMERSGLQSICSVFKRRAIVARNRHAPLLLGGVMRLVLSSLIDCTSLRNAVVVALPGDVRISW